MYQGRETVAVIAVHGVGDQQPFETVRKIGDLLQDLDHRKDRQLADCFKVPLPCGPEGGTHAKCENPRYIPFRETTLRINVRPVVVGPGESKEDENGAAKRVMPPQSPGGPHGPFYARVQNMEDTARLTPDEVWWNFTRGQLECYRGDDPEDTYETVRLEGEKTDAAGNPVKDVHLYELYWADLSRLRGGIFSIFMELYQLLFHLSALGVHTVTAATAVNGGSLWKNRLWLQTTASFLLTTPILIVNLIMAGIALMAVGLDALSRRSPRTQFLIVAAFVLPVLLAGMGFAVWRFVKARVTTQWWWAPLLIAPAVIAAWCLLAWRDAWYAGMALDALEGCILLTLVGVATGLILRAYDRRRPGALRWGFWFALSVAAIGSISFSWASVGNRIAVCARFFETAFLELAACWALFALAAIALFILRVRNRREPGRSTWTGVLLLSLPAAVFIMVSATSWALIGEFLRNFLRKDWLYIHLWDRAGAAQPVTQIIAYALNHEVFMIFCLSIIGFGIAAIPAVWGMAPSMLAEVSAPSAYKSVDRDYSSTLGNWLNNAFRGLSFSGLLLWAMVTLGIGGIIVYILWRGDVTNSSLIEGGGGLGALVFTALFTARRSLEKMAIGLVTVIDILLDVDNWLREMPRDSNPKARILGRYASLLRYILNWKRDPLDPSSGYDRIVILSHSQGTIVTADLLRFLSHEAASSGGWKAYDPQLERLGGDPFISMFTMGSPLRQLYNLRFPYLYGWAGFPRPAQLAGVGSWINAYRSGDYVGRGLWLEDVWTPVTALPLPALPLPNPAGTTDYCIGAGAHTHYWDNTAPAIAYQLDLLI